MNTREVADLKHCKDPKAVTEYSKKINCFCKNVDE